MRNLYNKYYMATKSKYMKIALDVLTHNFISTNQVKKNIQKKTGKSVHFYLLDRVLHDLLTERKVERQEMKFGNHKIVLWRKVKE